MTQRWLAQEAGITEKYLSRVELGLVTPSALIALRLARALDLGLDELVEAPAERVHPTSAAIARVLHDRTDQELDLARRVLVELFR
jgi:transcriptional regulator with XRE-family HTH domain